MSKKHSIISYHKLDREFKKRLAEEFPDGLMDYARKITKLDNTWFYAVDYETEDAHYLIKVDVSVDNEIIRLKDDEEDLFEDSPISPKKSKAKSNGLAEDELDLDFDDNEADLDNIVDPDELEID